MKTIKIDIYVSAISRKNGGSSSILDLTKALICGGFDVIVYTRFGYLDRYIYGVKDFKFFKKVKINQKPILRNAHIFSRLIKTINFYKPEQRSPDIIIDAELMDFNKLKFDNKPFIILNHAGSVEAFNTFLKGLSIEYIDFVKNYDGLLFQSKEQKNDSLKLVGADMKYYHLYPSVSENQLNCFERSETPFEKYFNIVHIGTVSNRKNQLEVIEIANSFKHEKNIQFHLIGPVGDSLYHQNLLDRINLYKLSNIKIWGFRSDYPKFLKHCDLVIQVSKSEGVSRIIREAYYFKKPVVSYRISGCEEVILNCKTGRILEYGDRLGIIDVIQNLYKNPEEVNYLGVEAFRFYKKYFAEEAYKERAKNIFNGIHED